MTSNTTNVSAEKTDAAGPIRVSTDGLAVEKAPAVHSDEAVKVVFTIASRCEEAIEFRIRDPLPEEIEPDAIGFHHEYDRANWHVAESGHVVYEGVVDPGTDRETLYGALVSSLDQLELFCDPPSIDVERVETPAAASDDVGDAEVVRGDGKADDEPGGSDDASEVPSPEAFSEDLDDPLAPEPSAGDRLGRPTDDERGSLIAALVDELEERELAEAERAVLRSSLGVESSNSVDVRLAHVRERVDDLEAYREALREFIDENGEASELVEEFRDEVATVNESVDEMTDRIAAIDDEVGESTARLDELSDVEETAATLSEDVDDLRRAVETLDRRLDGDVERLEEAVAAIEASVDERMESLSTDLDALREDVERGKEWREQLCGAIQVAPDAGETGVVGD